MVSLVSHFLEFLVVGIFVIILFELMFLGRKQLASVEAIVNEGISDSTKAKNHLYLQRISDANASPKWLAQAKLWFFPAIVFMVAFKIIFDQESMNFPLYLVLTVFTTGGIALFDILFMRRKRLALLNKASNIESVAAEGELEANVAQELESVECSKSFFPVLTLVLVLRSFIIEPFQIPSPSMVPTLEVGDFILVNKFTYGIRLPVIRTKVFDVSDPQRGDAMVFFPPNDKRYFIKRVIGLPGDKIRYANNQLFINGQLIENTHIMTEPHKDRRFYSPFEQCVPKGSYQLFDEKLGDTVHKMRKCTIPVASRGDRTWVVPEGHYFMMGDNRDNSSDSRAWGFVPEENIVGKAFAIWMHWEGLKSWPSFSRVGGID